MKPSFGPSAIKTRKDFVRLFYREHTLDEERLGELTGRSIKFQQRLLEVLSSSARPLIGSTFPRKWRDMRPPRVGDWIHEFPAALTWTVAKLSAFKQKIRAALRVQDTAETALLAGRIDKSDETLVDFQESYGQALWVMDMQFLIAQFTAGFHGNRTELDEFSHQSENDWVNVLAFNSSARASLSVSTREYHEATRLIVPTRGSAGISEAVSDYIDYRFFDIVPDSNSGFCNLLYFESRHSLIDLYRTLLRLLSKALGTITDQRSIDAIVHLAHSIDDPLVVSMATVATCGEFTLPSVDSAKLWECVDRLAYGEYSRCFELAHQQLSTSPRVFIWYDLLACAAVGVRNYTACPQVFRTECAAQQVLSGLFDWYSARNSRGESLEGLRRLSRALQPTALGPALAEFITLFDHQPTPLGRDHASTLSSPVILPQFAYGVRDAHRARTYLRRIKDQLQPASGFAVVEDHYRLLEDENADVFQAVPSSEALRHRSAVYHEKGDLKAVAATLTRLRKADPRYSGSHPELLVCEAEALLTLRDLDSAATILADLYCDDSRLLPPILLRQVAGLLKDPTFAPNKSNVAWPLLAMAAFNDDRLQLDLDRVHDFVGDYIEARGATRPTELLGKEREPSRHLLVFLRDCCIPDVLESSIWFRSLEELLNERLSLCESLINHAELPSAGLPEEVEALTRRLAILDLTSQIQRSRIFINTDAILRTLDEATWAQTNSFLSVRALRSQELRRGLKLLGMSNTEGGKVLVVVVDQGITFFKEIFEKIKQKFLYSPELGLDANLSQRVRHGTLAGELRATFDRLRLSTKTRGDGTYEPNQ